MFLKYLKFTAIKRIAVRIFSAPPPTWLRPACRPVLICAKVRPHLRENQIRFTESDATKDKRGKRDLASLGSDSIPVILMEKRRINDCQSTALQDPLAVAGLFTSR